jgi:hypothetical protein
LQDPRPDPRPPPWGAILHDQKRIKSVESAADEAFNARYVEDDFWSRKLNQTMTGATNDAEKLDEAKVFPKVSSTLVSGLST